MTSVVSDAGEVAETSGYWFREENSPDWMITMRLKSLGKEVQSDFQHVRVIETAPFGKTLVLDHKTQSSQHDEHVYHETLVHPTMLAHPNPKRVYIGGGGEMATAREVLRHKSVEQCVMVDIDKVVVDFARTELQQWSEGTFDDPRLELVIGDAKGFLEKDDRAYDVIIMDIADPIEAGPGIALYCQEFYQFLMKSGRLAPGGFFVTQSGPGSFINVDECGSTIHKTLRSAFNNVACFHADIPSFGSNWGFNMAFGGPADLESFDKDVLSKINKDTKFLLSKSIDDIDKQIEERINGTLKFYDGVTHRGLFGIPRDMRIFLSKEERYMTLENPVFMH